MTDPDRPRDPTTGDVHTYPAPAITVTWDATRCLHFAECVRGLPAVFDPSRRPWIEPDLAPADVVAEVIRRCPTGALQYDQVDEPTETGYSPTQVKPTAWGPLLLRGALELEVAAGLTITETRMAACACGRSLRAPYCDGACRTSEDG